LKSRAKRISPKQNLLNDLRAYVIRIWPYLRIFIGFLALCAIGFLAFKSLRDSKINAEAIAWEGDVLGAYEESLSEEVVVISPSGIEFELNRPQEEEIEQARVRYEEKIERIQEEQRRIEEARRRERMIRVEALQQHLKRMGSPMAPYAELILDSCEKYGTHYCKFFLSIAGVESGFGRIPIGCCNAWGMVGKYYPSWEVSIPAASDWIASKYYLKGVNTFEALAYSSYGPQNPEKWIGDLYSFYNRIPL
jgi:hypothetical protein